jgi:signal recognition particle subunit SEC65
MSKTASPLLKELEEIASKLNIKVRYERTKARGGLCKKEEQYMVIIDKSADPHYKTSVLAEAIKKFDLSEIYISPKAREIIESAD